MTIEERAKPDTPAWPTGTGEYHEPPCEYCRTVSKRRCEKDAAGGACVSCKHGKRACEYSHPRFRRKGSDAEHAESGATAKSRVVRAARAAPKDASADPAPTQSAATPGRSIF